MPPHPSRSMLCTPVNRLYRCIIKILIKTTHSNIPNVIVQLYIRSIDSCYLIYFHPYTCAQHPEPINPSSLNFANKSRQEEPYVASSKRSVYSQECGVASRCSLESMSQISREKMSLRVDIHWPNLMKIGPRNSIPKKKIYVRKDI